MKDNEIRTLTLRFANLTTAGRFECIAKQHGCNPLRGMDGDWIKITTYFGSKADRSRLLSAWREESMEVVNG